MNMYDRFLKSFFPGAYLKRTQLKLAQRGYDAALTAVTDDWTNSSGKDVNKTVGKDQSKLIDRSRDLVRNSPYANRAIQVIVTNTVGYGISANITGENKNLDKIKELWLQVTESSLCDTERRSDFYTLQAQAIKAMVESGEVIIVKDSTSDAPSIRLLESEYLDNTSVYEQKNTFYGIKLDDKGRRLGYFIRNTRPGDKDFDVDRPKEVKSEHVIHLFRQDRLGQLRGVPWFHTVIETLKDLSDYNYATIIRQKISACLVGAITTTGGENLLPVSKQQEKLEEDTKMSPGSWKKLGPGEDVKFSAPPQTSGYSEFVRQCLMSVAVGIGITYESLTSDYSNVNFSSGRLGNLEFRKNIDSWRWNLLIPIFLDRYFEWFLEWVRLNKAMDTTGIKVDWVPPAYTMIDPTKEVTADKEAIKAGLKSKSMALREAGLNPDVVREEIKKEREEDKKAGLQFDVYDTQVNSKSVEPNSPNDEESNTKPNQENKVE